MPRNDRPALEKSESDLVSEMMDALRETELNVQSIREELGVVLRRLREWIDALSDGG